MANATMSKDEILDAIGNMSVFELAELIEAFKSKFNVTIAAAPVGGARRPLAALVRRAAAVEEQTEFDVVLKEAGAQEDPGHQGRPRAHRPGPEGSEGPRRRRAADREGRRVEGRGRARSRPSSKSRARPSK